MHNPIRRTAVIFLLPVVIGVCSPAFSDDVGQLAGQMASSKHKLSDGIRQLSQGPAVPLAAKYKVEQGELQLIVWLAEKGFEHEAQYNVLEEFVGPAKAETWSPAKLPFKDLERTAKAGAQWALWATSPHTLLDIVTTAEKSGTIVGAEPRFDGRKPFVWVRLLEAQSIHDVRYDLSTGKVIPGGAPPQLKPQ